MDLETKNKEYVLMQNSDKRTIRVDIPDGPSLTCLHSWDYKTNLNETSFKTYSEITKEHPLLKVERLDLSPINNQKLWKVTVKRRPDSNLKNQPRNGNNRA